MFVNKNELLNSEREAHLDRIQMHRLHLEDPRDVLLAETAIASEAHLDEQPCEAGLALLVTVLAFVLLRPAW